ncbi:hypothetical protein LSG31_03020 [Fodinisporobacter ferrooxydans]|uniref:Uncharacterized protein n=1 Tax=Fodinisporobacter ferrooxydans TaxID=2901836 RepID=A0ABY4CTN4_9BACL|nr:hypothetical protein LSG31_03020 [Alicyclobacillaceae bacterium MYW30-H2]
MKFITREILDKYVGDKEIIEESVLIRLMKEEFGRTIPNEEEYDSDNLAEDQRKRMTKAISENVEILKQIKNAKIKRSAQGLSSYSEDEKEFDRLVHEVNKNG